MKKSTISGIIGGLLGSAAALIPLVAIEVITPPKADALEPITQEMIHGFAEIGVSLSDAYVEDLVSGQCEYYLDGYANRSIRSCDTLVYEPLDVELEDLFPELVGRRVYRVNIGNSYYKIECYSDSRATAVYYVNDEVVKRYIGSCFTYERASGNLVAVAAHNVPHFISFPVK